jgi:NAD(P)-dependent dehydrogenase (short-subunit alcohol dehydrogenase family)
MRILVTGDKGYIGAVIVPMLLQDGHTVVGQTVPGCRLEYAKDGGPDTRCYRVDFSKVTRVLPDFKPQWNARAGAKELYDAIRRHGLQLEDFEGPKYKRIAHIQQLLSSGRLDDSLRWRAEVPA